MYLKINGFRAMTPSYAGHDSFLCHHTRRITKLHAYWVYFAETALYTRNYCTGKSICLRFYFAASGQLYIYAGGSV